MFLLLSHTLKPLQGLKCNQVQARVLWVVGCVILSICGRPQRACSSKDGSLGLQVAGRTLQLGVGLGLTLAAVLALGKGGLPRLFTGDAAVLAAIGHIFPWVILSQPINALAFVWDGILYGAGGFSYAAKACSLLSTQVLYTMCMHCKAMLLFPSQKIIPWTRVTACVMR